jgi:hypothetical protein
VRAKAFASRSADEGRSRPFQHHLGMCHFQACCSARLCNQCPDGWQSKVGLCICTLIGQEQLGVFCGERRMLRSLIIGDSCRVSSRLLRSAAASQQNLSVMTVTRKVSAQPCLGGMPINRLHTAQRCWRTAALRSICYQSVVDKVVPNPWGEVIVG